MTSRLRISIVTETYLPQLNGVSRALDRLVRHVTASGDEVQLITPRYPPPGPPLPVGACLTAFRAVSLPFYREVLMCAPRPRSLANALRKFAPQVVHIATEGSLGWVALRAAHRLSVPIVSSYHTQFPHYLRFYRLGGLEPAAWRYLRWFHNRTNLTLCPTESIRRDLQRRGFQRVHLWPRGVNSEVFRPDKRSDAVRRELGLGPRSVAVGYVGRLAAEKNLGMLLDACLQLPGDPPVRLVLVGDGPLRPRLEAAAGDRVVFTGYRTGEDLSRVYASLDLFVLPSLTETFGNVLLEAMASGVPAVGFPAPGPVDVIQDGDTGLIAPEISADALSRTLLTLVEDAARRRAMGRRARQWAETQSWAAINSAVRDSYQGVAAQRRLWRPREATRLTTAPKAFGERLPLADDAPRRST